MKKIFLIALLILAMILTNGCSSIKVMELNNEQKAWMQEVMKTSLTVQVPKDSLDIVWSRAYKFITTYATKKLQIISDYHLETYNPSTNTFYVDYGYNVDKLVLSNTVEITVSGTAGNMFTSGWLNENLHIFAYYLTYGEIKYPELIDVRGSMSSYPKYNK